MSPLLRRLLAVEGGAREEVGAHGTKSVGLKAHGPSPATGRKVARTIGTLAAVTKFPRTALRESGNPEPWRLDGCPLFEPGAGSGPLLSRLSGKSTIAWISFVRPSRRPLRGLLRMRYFLNAIKGLPHAEERPKSLPQA
jgi:hypothetical protein